MSNEREFLLIEVDLATKSRWIVGRSKSDQFLQSIAEKRKALFPGTDQIVKPRYKAEARKAA
jgi:hypothetical protein